MKQKILKPNYKLDPEEIELLDSIDRGEWQPVPNPIEEISKLRKGAKITNQLLKSKNINIRLQPNTIEKLRESAARQGLPYQTLVSSILHRYATGQTIIPIT